MQVFKSSWLWDYFRNHPMYFAEPNSSAVNLKNNSANGILSKLPARPGRQRIRGQQAAYRSPLRVAVLVDTSTTWGRGIVAGIGDYCREHQRWEIFVEPRGQEEQMRLPKGWQGDGVIARVGEPQLADELSASGQPVVNVSSILLAESARFPRVTTDLVASGEMAANHFLERGFRNFAYFSLKGLSYVSTHQQAFAQAVQQAGGELASLTVKPRAGAEPDWRMDLAKLAEWIRRLPKPVAILCWNASSGRELIFACHEAGIHVPEEVAVLCQADDEILCEISIVPLSAVAVAADRIGYQAAGMLDQLMRRRKPAQRNLLISPLSIVTRQSTQTIALSDPVLVKALSFIRQNATQPWFGVPDVARHAGASRRGLERKFMEVLQHPPAEEIRRIRLEQAKRLLAETRLPMPQVAESAGFSSQAYLASSFRHHFGTSPLQFRKENYSLQPGRSPRWGTGAKVKNI